jgi:acetyltransferase-like isoleucine patch superfamily enzyme
MDRKSVLRGKKAEKIFNDLHEVYEELDNEFKIQFDRSLPFTESIFDRWERAKRLGWGDQTSVYDSAFIFGEVIVGKKCWIGPYTIIDGSGGLTIGDNCTISAGTHIYSHDNIKQTLSGGKIPIDKKQVSIGSNTYISPNVIITKGVQIGNCCLVGANSLVKSDFPDYSIIAGNPAKKIGTIQIENDQIQLIYKK